MRGKEQRTEAACPPIAIHHAPSHQFVARHTAACLAAPPCDVATKSTDWPIKGSFQLGLLEL